MIKNFVQPKNHFEKYFLYRGCLSQQKLETKNYCPKKVKQQPNKNQTITNYKEKIRKEKFQMCLYLSFYDYKIIFKLQIFKVNQLMVPIEKKPAPGDHESSLKISLARCPCAQITLGRYINFTTKRKKLLKSIN